jgi:quinol monooxygenase YgiN
VKPIAIINVITAKEGKMDQLVQLQLEGQRKFAGAAEGWLGGRLHRSVDQNKMIFMVIFKTIDHHKKWMQNPDFQEFREKVLQLVEKIEPGYYEILSEAGQLQNWNA